MSTPDIYGSSTGHTFFCFSSLNAGRVHHKLNLKVFLEMSDVVSISKSVLFELNLECQFAH